MGVLLTRKDVFDLLDNSRNINRLAVTNKICRGYNSQLYSQDEIEIAEEILRLLAKDTEILVRATLSESLKLADDLPHDIALSLAKDVEEVAIPMLQFSNVLTDADLLEIIYSAEVQKLLAISHRTKLNSNIATSLVDRKIEQVTQSVLKNEDFNNNKTEFELFIEKSAHNENLMRQIIENSTLPVTISEKLLTEISGQLLKQIKTKYNITPLQLDKYISHSQEISTLSIIDHNSRGEEIDHLVNHLFNFGRLSASMVLSAACMGRKRFFVAAIAKRAGISKENALILIEKGGREGMHALMKKAGIPDKLFEAVELVLVLIDEKKSKEPNIGVKEFCGWLVSKLEYFVDKKNIEYLSYMIAIAKQSQQVNTGDNYNH